MLPGQLTGSTRPTKLAKDRLGAMYGMLSTAALSVLCLAMLAPQARENHYTIFEARSGRCFSFEWSKRTQCRAVREYYARLTSESLLQESFVLSWAGLACVFVYRLDFSGMELVSSLEVLLCIPCHQACKATRDTEGYISTSFDSRHKLSRWSASS